MALADLLRQRAELAQQAGFLEAGGGKRDIYSQIGQAIGEVGKGVSAFQTGKQQAREKALKDLQMETARRALLPKEPEVTQIYTPEQALATGEIKGPYKIIRHPGYLAGIIGLLFQSAMLGSYLGYIPSIVSIVILIYRTYKEDKTLMNELNGYKEYAEKVKYKLFPYFW